MSPSGPMQPRLSSADYQIPINSFSGFAEINNKKARGRKATEADEEATDEAKNVSI